jgi:hypothetical protein
MHSAFQYDQYLLKRQVLALTGKFRLYSPGGNLVLFSQQKMFRLKEDIRAYSDESRSQELLYIQARQVIDFSACYDVYDSLSSQKVGALRRRGWRSLTRDVWDVLDPGDHVIGVLQEDDVTLALLRRVFLRRAADLRQRFNLFRYELDLDFRDDKEGLLDRRLGIAAGLLLGTIEGKQES